MNRYCTFACLMVLAGDFTASAAENPLVANIPFEFYVGKTRLPAGDYSIKKMEHPGVIAVRSKDGVTNAIVMTNSTQAPKITAEGKLVFNRYGDAHFLSQIWRPGTNAGAQVIEHQVEREMKVAKSRSEVQVATAAR